MHKKKYISRGAIMPNQTKKLIMMIIRKKNLRGQGQYNNIFSMLSSIKILNKIKIKILGTRD